MKVSEYSEIATEALVYGFSADAFAVFDPDHSPLTREGRILPLDHVKRILIEFSFFSRALPEVLAKAFEVIGPDAPLSLKHEILLNLAEELGYVEPVKGQIGLSHHALLIAEIERHFGVDPEKIEMAPRTRVFLGKVQGQFNGQQAPAFGALAALELSAVPEIKLVREICTRCFRAEGIEASREFWLFLDAHISEFEIQHSARLIETAPDVLRSDDARVQAVAGFRETAGHLVDWWAQA